MALENETDSFTNGLGPVFIFAYNLSRPFYVQYHLHHCSWGFFRRHLFLAPRPGDEETASLGCADLLVKFNIEITVGRFERGRI